MVNPLLEKQTKVVNHILEKKTKLLYVYSSHDTSIATTDDSLPQHYKLQPIILVTICQNLDKINFVKNFPQLGRLFLGA